MLFRELRILPPEGFIATQQEDNSWKLTHTSDTKGYECKRGNHRAFKTSDALMSTLKRAGVLQPLTLRVHYHVAVS